MTHNVISTNISISLIPNRKSGSAYEKSISRLISEYSIILVITII